MSRPQLTSDLIKNSCRLSLMQRLRVLKMLSKAGVPIHEASDGSRVNIDLLDEGLLSKLNDMVERMLTSDIPERFRM